MDNYVYKNNISVLFNYKEQTLISIEVNSEKITKEIKCIIFPLFYIHILSIIKRFPSKVMTYAGSQKQNQVNIKYI